jgi:alanine racemase
VGAGLFGIDPARTTALRPALRLTAPVVSVKRVPRGSGVGYSHTWSTARDTSLALLPLGYGDGLPRTASGRAEVQLRGRRRPIVGVFSMDQVVVDVGDDLIRPGETATIFGSGDTGEPTVREWAEWAGTIDHAIMVGIGSRVRRSLSTGAAS